MKRQLKNCLKEHVITIVLLSINTRHINPCMLYIFSCSFLSVFVSFIYLSDFVETWPLGFRLKPGAARLQTSAVAKKVWALLSWSVQLDIPGTALTVGGWIRPRVQNYWGREGAILTQPF